MGHYVNPDEIGFAFKTEGYLDLRPFGLACGPKDIQNFLRSERRFVHKAESAGEQITLQLQDSRLWVRNQDLTDYNAALAAGFLRRTLVASGQSFTFESVLSDKGKLEELEAAKQLGYRIYLYFVCTVDPDINVDRVANRVAKGGHPVPKESILARYERTLANLLPAFLLADRAYLFDNSGERMELAVEADGKDLHLLVDQPPTWVVDHLIAPLINRA
jgi:predicted ABC-type ATPase